MSVAFDLPAAVQLFQAGHSIVEIADACGVSVSTCSRRLRAAGCVLKKGPPPDTARMKEAIYLRDGRGLSFAKIGEAMEISRQGAHNLYQRAHEALAAGLLDDDSDDSDEDTNG